jgi:hypothetical protein
MDMQNSRGTCSFDGSRRAEKANEFPQGGRWPNVPAGSARFDEFSCLLGISVVPGCRESSICDIGEEILAHDTECDQPYLAASIKNDPVLSQIPAPYEEGPGELFFSAPREGLEPEALHPACQPVSIDLRSLYATTQSSKSQPWIHSHRSHRSSLRRVAWLTLGVRSIDDSWNAERREPRQPAFPLIRFLPERLIFLSLDQKVN